MKDKLKLSDSKLSLNQLYDCTRRSVISFFARNYAYQQGYDSADFEYVMFFVKKAYQAFYKSLEEAQRKDL